MQFRIRLDPKVIEQQFADVKDRQIPYAVSLGLNRIANVGQKAEQNRLLGEFHLRREKFILQGVYISKADRASKTSWRVTLQFQGDRSFLGRMEQGGLKDPTKGHWLWKPNPAVFGDRIIMRSNPLHPSNLHFRSPIGNKGKGWQLQGDQRTFMVKSNGSRTGPLVLQRTGAASTGYNHTSQLRTKGGQFDGMLRNPGERKRKQGVRLLYTLVSKVHVPAKLEFVNTIEGAVQAAWPTVMGEALRDALRSAR